MNAGKRAGDLSIKLGRLADARSKNLRSVGIWGLTGTRRPHFACEGVRPRVEKLYPRVDEVRHVARDHREAMLDGRCGDHGVALSARVGHMQCGAQQRRVFGKRQAAPGEGRAHPKGS